MVHDRRYPYDGGETRAKVSEDDGLTWRPETYHLATGHGYPPASPSTTAPSSP